MPRSRHSSPERSAAIVALAIAALVIGCRPEPPSPAADASERLAKLGRPNIVLFLVDTLRADVLTPYGAPEGSSPGLARWAEQGVVFERVMSQSSWTKVSMASLMTSMWPRTHGVREVDDGLAQGAVTLPELLQQAGYRTYAVQTNGWLAQSFGFQQGFDSYRFPLGASAGGAPGLTSSLWAHADNVYANAVGLLDEHEAERPFFLYLHFMDVHEYAAPSDVPRPDPGPRGAYRAAARWVDEVVDRVRRDLDERGLLDRTVLVLASDHGETFGEHGVNGHARDVLSAVLHVPLIIRLPFPVEATRISTQVRNVDLAPTLLELAQLPVPASFEGQSLVPLLAGGEPEPDRPSYASLSALLFGDAALQDSTTTGHWTYARNRAGDPPAEFLFDRSVDPAEGVNLVGLEPEAYARMRERLDAHLAVPPAELTVENRVRIDPGIAQRLRAMGYLQ